MKKILVAISAVFVTSEAFAIEQCPAVLRADLEKIATTKENGTFEMRGKDWTLTYSPHAENWTPILENDTPIGDRLMDSRIIMHKGNTLLHCEYQVFTVRQNQYNHQDVLKGQFFIETIIKDDFATSPRPELESPTSLKSHPSSSHHH